MSDQDERLRAAPIPFAGAGCPALDDGLGTLYGSLLRNGGRVLVSPPRRASARRRAGKAGRDEWSAVTKRSEGTTAVGRATAKREAASAPTEGRMVSIGGAVSRARCGGQTGRGPWTTCGDQGTPSSNRYKYYLIEFVYMVF